MKRTALHAAYARLLELYPRAFRERFGESMRQTFNDLCAERQQNVRGMVRFVGFVFVDTAAGIGKEHIAQLASGEAMKRLTADLGFAAIISLFTVLPFAILEAVNVPLSLQDVPGLLPLFTFLWLLPFVFIMIVKPMVRALRSGSVLTAQPVVFVVKVAFLGLVAFVWAGLLLDQFPCFMGVPNCD